MRVCVCVCVCSLCMGVCVHNGVPQPSDSASPQVLRSWRHRRPAASSAQPQRRSCATMSSSCSERMRRGPAGTRSTETPLCRPCNNRGRVWWMTCPTTVSPSPSGKGLLHPAQSKVPSPPQRHTGTQVCTHPHIHDEYGSKHAQTQTHHDSSR